VAGGVAGGLTAVTLMVDSQACINEGKSQTECVRDLTLAISGMAVITGTIGVAAETLVALGVSAATIAAVSTAFAAVGVPLAIYGVYAAGERWVNAPEVDANTRLQQQQKELLVGFGRLAQRVQTDIDQLRALRSQSIALCRQINSQVQSVVGVDQNSKALMDRLRALIASIERGASQCNEARSIATTINSLQQKTKDDEDKVKNVLDTAITMADRCSSRTDANKIQELYGNSKNLAARLQVDAAIARGRNNKLSTMKADVDSVTANLQAAEEIRSAIGLNNVRIHDLASSSISNRATLQSVNAQFVGKRAAIQNRIDQLRLRLPNQTPSEVYREEFVNAQNSVAGLSQALSEIPGTSECAFAEVDPGQIAMMVLNGENLVSSANTSFISVRELATSCTDISTQDTVVEAVEASANWALSAVAMNDFLPKKADACLAKLDGPSAVAPTTATVQEPEGDRAALIGLLDSGIGLLDQCRLVDAEAALNQVLAAIGGRTLAFYTDLRTRAQTAIQRKQTIYNTLQLLGEGIERTETMVKQCDAEQSLIVLDKLQELAGSLPAACGNPRARVADLRDRADQLITSKQTMDARIANGEAQIKACNFSAATVAFRDPVFNNPPACDAHRNLAQNAAKRAEVAQKFETVVDRFQERLRAGRVALAANRKAEAEAAAKQVLNFIGALSVYSCDFDSEQVMARQILAQATVKSDVDLSFLGPESQATAPPPESGNLLSEAEKEIQQQKAEDKMEKERIEKERIAREQEQARQQAERQRKEAERQRVEREQTAREAQVAAADCSNWPHSHPAWNGRANRVQCQCDSGYQVAEGTTGSCQPINTPQQRQVPEQRQEDPFFDDLRNTARADGGSSRPEINPLEAFTQSFTDAVNQIGQANRQYEEDRRRNERQWQQEQQALARERQQAVSERQRELALQQQDQVRQRQEEQRQQAAQLWQQQQARERAELEQQAQQARRQAALRQRQEQIAKIEKTIQEFQDNNARITKYIPCVEAGRKLPWRDFSAQDCNGKLIGYTDIKIRDLRSEMAANVAAIKSYEQERRRLNEQP
jgi:hypothetical protein